MPNLQGVVQTNPANATSGKHIHNYSTFDKSLSYRLYNTLRFGEYTPSFVMEGVPTDEIELNTKDFIDSLSLNAPFKGQIRKIKESFAVPNMAILPKNWDKIYAQPSNGDDVPKDANCVLQDFPNKFKTVWYNAYSVVVNNALSTANHNHWLTALLRTLVLGEYIYSNGSLLSVCGYHGSAQFRYIMNSGQTMLSYDEWLDQVVFKVFSHVDSFELTGGFRNDNRLFTFKGLSGNPSDIHYKHSFRHALELMRENPLLYVSTSNLTADFDSVVFSNLTEPDSLFLFTAVNAGPTFIAPDESNTSNSQDDITDMSQTNLNLSRLLAYQLVCFHYYTNSSLDFIYSAELYRQYIWDLLWERGFTKENFSQFSWNDYHIPYDALSGKLLTYGMLQQSSLQPNNALTWPSLQALGTYPDANPAGLTPFALYAAIFAFRKSLRYGDYFVGARPRPLAPVNTDVSVNNNMVSVVDVTRNIQAQRFANAVMRSRSKIEEYVKSLFGRSPQPDYHNPFLLNREEEMVFGDEVQNTGEAQINAQGVGKANSRTANFAAGLGQFTFTFHNDDAHSCIYLQIISFDIRRAYTRSVERPFLHIDRFDMFNPDFQYIGDQPVYGIELGYPYNSKMPSIFAYQSRDMEYKERFDQAAGGFVENLPGWILTDGFMSFGEFKNIDPDFIRSYNTELDQFFLSLSGYSLGSYFHFICITQNNVNAKRPMAVDPQILA